VNLAVVFGAAVLWPAATGAAERSADLAALAVATLAFAGLATRRVGIIPAVLLGGLLGLLRHLCA